MLPSSRHRRPTTTPVAPHPTRTTHRTTPTPTPSTGYVQAPNYAPVLAAARSSRGRRRRARSSSSCWDPGVVSFLCWRRKTVGGVGGIRVARRRCRGLAVHWEGGVGGVGGRRLRGGRGSVLARGRRERIHRRHRSAKVDGA